MTHDGEELLLGPLALLGCGKRPLEQADLLLLFLLLLLHVAEAEDGLVGNFLSVGEQADADPALFAVDFTEKLAAVVAHLLFHQLTDTLQGEAFGKVGSGPLVQTGDNGLHQVTVVSRRAGQLLLDQVGACGHLIGSVHHIDPVQGIVHIAQHLDRLGGPLSLVAEPAVPQPHTEGHGQKQAQTQDVPDQNVLYAL